MWGRCFILLACIPCSQAPHNCIIVTYIHHTRTPRPRSQMVLVHGNLKVKMPALEKTCSGKNGQMEIVEPSVIGFVGVCELIESATSADDITIPTTILSPGHLISKRKG